MSSVPLEELFCMQNRLRNQDSPERQGHKKKTGFKLHSWNPMSQQMMHDQMVNPAVYAQMITVMLLQPEIEPG